MNGADSGTTAADHGPSRGAAGPPRSATLASGVLGCCVLVVVAAAAAGLAMRFGGGRPGQGRAVALATVACLPGFLAAWLLARGPTADPGRALTASLAAIILRTLPPLAALAWLTGPQKPAAVARAADGPAPADAAGILVAVYLALLVTDVLLHMMAGRAGRGRGH